MAEGWTEDRLSTKLGGWLVTIGALGVTIITGIYAAAPPAASVPLPADVTIAATRMASLKLTLAGSVGIVADILLIAGYATRSKIGTQTSWRSRPTTPGPRLRTDTEAARLLQKFRLT